jgi:hypothetical protein
MFAMRSRAAAAPGAGRKLPTVSGKRLLPLLLLVPLALLAAWIARQGSRRVPDRGAVLAALKAVHGPVLPAAPAGANRSDPLPYDRESLYEAIDGAADGYLARGFVAAQMATYAWPGSAGPEEVAAEIHRFESEAGARGQRDAERPSSATAVAGLVDTVSDGNVLLAVSGRDYLKLTSLNPGPAAAPRLEALARALLQEKTR